LATVSFVLSFAPLLWIPAWSLELPVAVYYALWFLPAPSLIASLMALRQIRHSEGRLGGRGMVDAAIALAIIPGLVLGLLDRPTRERMCGVHLAGQSACANNLKQMGIVFEMYSSESPEGLWPPLPPNTGQFMCEAKAIYPEYLTDPVVLLCPAIRHSAWSAWEDGDLQLSQCFEDSSYMYLGYVVTSDEEMEAFAEVYRERVAQGLGFDEDLAAPPGRGSMGTDTFYRLWEKPSEWTDSGALRSKRRLPEDLVRALLGDETEANAAREILKQIPVMWDRMYSAGESFHSNHTPAGSNVLYMDGHVESVEYPGKWPVTKRMAEITAELDPRGLERVK